MLSTVATLEEAIEIAEQATGAYPAISVFDSAGKEIFSLGEPTLAAARHGEPTEAKASG